MINDTIASIATALSNSGIGIIRVSGDDAVNIVNKIFVNKKGEHVLASFSSHTIHYGFIVFEEKEIDEVMVSLMKAPNSFTREDVVEINTHGGIYVCKAVLNAVLSSGARLAEPGEFTKRAFLNGRIDLSKAEAVIDVIASESRAGLNNSLKHLNGILFDKIKEFRDKLIYEIAFIESALDDPEHISLDGYCDKLSTICDDLYSGIISLYKSFNKGKILKEGINTVIVGKPNVGKSSLLNMLTGEERAIVTEIAGTTRDTIEEKVLLGEVHLNLFDTAGIRNTEDIVENIGVNRAKECAENADLVLFLLDSTKEIDEEDRKIYEIIKEKNVIILVNKTDREDSILNTETVFKAFFNESDAKENVIPISCKLRDGLDLLEQRVNTLFFEGSIKEDNELVITNLRQAEQLKIASDSILKVKESISLGLPEDFFSIDLMNSYEALGKIIGEDVDDDLVNEIFSKFCMGK